MNESEIFTISSYFKSELLDIISLAIPLDSEEKLEHDYKVHVKYSVTLSKIVEKHPDLQRYMLDTLNNFVYINRLNSFRFVLTYFEKYPAPFEDTQSYYPHKKKTKLTKPFEVSDFEIVNATYVILKLYADFFRRKWNWSYFLSKYYNHDDDNIQWFKR